MRLRGKRHSVLYAPYPRCLNAMDERQFEQQHDKMIPLL
jgi:hypothetical protein